MADQQDIWTSSGNRNSMLPVLGGSLGLSVAMGIGRFAYTPLLPVMQEQLHFSTAFAGELASWNYVGYLVGAMLAAVIPSRLQRDMKFRYRMVVLGLIGSVVTTWLMGFTVSHVWWCIERGLGGLFSAIVLVVSSSLVMDWLARRGNAQQSGILYSGVGIGIVFTGVLVPLFTHGGKWQLGWLGLGCFGAILTMLALTFLRTVGRADEDGQLRNALPREVKSPFPLWSITLVYGLEGLGYIVMATFITEFFHGGTTLPWLGTVSWVVVGLAGAPSTWLWAKAARSWTVGRATIMAFLAQGVGILLPVIHSGVWEAVVGSILFGGTFMGITSLTLTIGRMSAQNRSGTAIGLMTAVFSLGQVIGPILAGILTTQTHTYSMSMMLSGVIVLAAAALLWLTREKTGPSHA